MSHAYSLLCVECREVLELGKIANIDADGSSMPWTICGWRDQGSLNWLEGIDLWRMVERFLILHRGHELRVISEEGRRRVDPEGALLSHIDDQQTLLCRPVEPAPDDYEDAEALDQLLLEKFRR